MSTNNTNVPAAENTEAVNKTNKPATQYRWETLNKSWEHLRETSAGRLTIEYADEARKSSTSVNNNSNNSAAHRRGLQRALCIIIDNSASMADKNCVLEYNQNAAAANMTPQMQVKETLSELINQFFVHNPLSMLQLIQTSDKLATAVTPMSGNRRQQLDGLNALPAPSGEPSLQNALLLARSTLSQLPKYGTREMLVLFNSLHTTDPGNITKTIALLAREKMIVSGVSMSAEMYVCKRLSELTQGEYHVAKHYLHFQQLVLGAIQPPLATALADNALDTKLIRMGFPKFHSGVFREGVIAVDEDASDDHVTGPAICVCHQRVQTEQGYYPCPQCRAVLCELPVNCKICGLLLVSSPLLARSYHHLFPVPSFTEVLVRAESRTCQACHRQLEVEDTATQCVKCQHVFCLECDHFIHESLFNCPGCELEHYQT